VREELRAVHARRGLRSHRLRARRQRGRLDARGGNAVGCGRSASERRALRRESLAEEEIAAACAGALGGVVYGSGVGALRRLDAGCGRRGNARENGV